MRSKAHRGIAATNRGMYAFVPATASNIPKGFATKPVGAKKYFSLYTGKVNLNGITDFAQGGISSVVRSAG